MPVPNINTIPIWKLIWNTLVLANFFVIIWEYAHKKFERKNINPKINLINESFVK